MARREFLGSVPPKFEHVLLGVNKLKGKRLPQLCYIKMKLCYDPFFIDIGVTVDT